MSNQAASWATKAGTLIGNRLEIRRALGRGGFGEVYLAYDRALRAELAVKTIRSEFFTDNAAKDAFKKEALTWVRLERHPCILSAMWVEELSGRLLVEMLYVPPDSRGRVSLTDHLAASGGKSLDQVQTLKWALEFCHGMEHARRHGIIAHRDIKPSNILITPKRTLKISDFGLASAAELISTNRKTAFTTRNTDGTFGLSLVHSHAEDKAVCGTPGYMAPEVVLGRGADERSDIYSFGLVFWQMATGSSVPPFHVPTSGDVDEYLRGVFERQIRGPLPLAEGGGIQNIIHGCLQPDPARRYEDFAQLRTEIQHLLRTKWGIVGGPPASEDDDHKRPGFWNNKGYALFQLGENEEALTCFSKAIEIDPTCADLWFVKGGVLHKIGRYDEAARCYCRALELKPNDEEGWLACGDAYVKLSRSEDALACYSKALEINPQIAKAWLMKGLLLRDRGDDLQDAIACLENVIKITPGDARVWLEKAHLEIERRDYRIAVQSLKHFLDVARSDDAWSKDVEDVEQLLARLPNL